MKNKKILLTGGAGYSGSHVLRQLGAKGEDVITLDNLSTGFRQAVTSGELVVGDTGDAALLDAVFGDNAIDAVMHFAAHTIKIRATLGWQPAFDDLDTIVRTSLAWERKIAARDPSAYWAE